MPKFIVPLLVILLFPISSLALPSASDIIDQPADSISSQPIEPMFGSALSEPVSECIEQKQLDGSFLAVGCCKYCSKGKACGNSCISRDKTCHQPKGCACDG